jgi:hypothetical protein
MNKLIVLFDKNLDYKNCRYRRNIYDYLIENGCKICYVGELINNDFEELFFRKFNKIPDFIFFGIMVDALSSRISYINLLKKKYGTKIGVYVDDLHTHHNKIKRCILLSDILFLSYPYLFNKFYENFKNKKIYYYNHSPVKIGNFNNNPNRVICLSGSINFFYPARQKLFNLKNKYNIFVLENNKFTLDFYIDKLSEYLCCFACVTKENYIVRKIFEILASGSLLFLYYGDAKLELEKLGFIDGIHYIGCNDIDFEIKIKWILDFNNINEITKIRLEGFNFVKNNFNRKIISEKLYKKILEFN